MLSLALTYTVHFCWAGICSVYVDQVQDHQVRVKVTGTKLRVIVCCSRVVCLWLKGNSYIWHSDEVSEVRGELVTRLMSVVTSQWAVALPGFIARGGGSWKLDRGALTVDFKAGCSSRSTTNITVTNSTDRNGCELLTSASASVDIGCSHDSSLSDLLRSELKMKLLKVEGVGKCPSAPYFWRRYWQWCCRMKNAD